MVLVAGLVDTVLSIGTLLSEDTVQLVSIVLLVDTEQFFGIVLALYFVHLHNILGLLCSFGYILGEVNDDPPAGVEVIPGFKQM